MSLLDKIENLQRKPKHVRYKILIISLAVIMSVIVFVWFSMFSLDNSKKNDKSVKAPIESIFNTFREKTIEFSSSVKDNVSGLKNQINNLLDNEK